MKNAKTNWLQRNRFLVGIISCYLIAFLFPSFGIKIYSFSPLDEELWGQKQTIRLILAITVLLSSIAVGVNSRSGQSMSSIRIGLRVGIIKVALSSLFLVFAVLAQMVPGESFQGLVLGMATILAMPTAISTIAWCTKKSGDGATTLVIIVFSTLVIPVVAVGISSAVRLMGVECELIDFDYVVGILLFSLAGPRLIGIAIGRWITKASFAQSIFALILLLNYCNGCITFDQIHQSGDWSIVFFGLLMTVLLGIVLTKSGYALANCTRASATQAVGIRLSILMHNTGLALVVLAESIERNPIIGLLPAFFTLVQHCLASQVTSPEIQDSS